MVNQAVIVRVAGSTPTFLIETKACASSNLERVSAFVIFSTNVPRLASFYETLLEATAAEEPTGDIRLKSENGEVLVHSVTKAFAKMIEVKSPPEPRERAVVKVVFDVEDMEVSLARVVEHGGVLTGRGFVLSGLERRDVLDPDGNVIQLRSYVRD
jgi:predicted enzyme related to lactoylglutathione lyase